MLEKIISFIQKIIKKNIISVTSVYFKVLQNI